MTMPETKRRPRKSGAGKRKLPVPPDAVEAMLGTLRVVVRPSVFRDEFRVSEVAADGKTIAELFDAADSEVHEHQTAVAWLNGHRLAREHWGLIRPKAGGLVCFAVLPGDQRTAMLIGGGLAITALAVLTGGAAGVAIGGLGGSIAGAGITAGVALGGELTLDVLA
jgi:hypothetical protein